MSVTPFLHPTLLSCILDPQTGSLDQFDGFLATFFGPRDDLPGTHPLARLLLEFGESASSFRLARG